MHRAFLSRARLLRRLVVCCALLAPAAAAPAADANTVIRSVRVEADGPFDAASVIELLELRPGTDLDRGRLRELITALFAGGRVEWLRVEAAESAEGLDVAVRISFRSTISRVTVEAEGLWRRARIRRWLRLEPGDPVTAADIEVARRQVERRLLDRGYADAVVEAYLEYDRRSNTVEVRFIVEQGPPQVLRSVIVEGLVGPEDAEGAQPEFKPGTRLTASLEERLRERTEENLRRMDYWEAEVLAAERVADGPQVDLLLRVDPGLRYRLELMAPPGRTEAAANAVPDPAREELHPAQTDALAEQVVENLQEAGFLLADAAASLQASGDEQVLRLEVDPGQRLEIAAVEFPGADSVSRNRLEDVVQVRRGAVGGRFQQEVSRLTLEEDRTALLDHYHREGFPYAAVEPPRIEAVEGGSAVRIVFPISEGLRWTVSGVRIEDLPVEAAAELEVRPLDFDEGDPWSPGAVSRATARLEAALADSGYPAGRVAAEVDTSRPGRAEVVFRIEPGPFVRVGEIIISGLEHTRETLVAAAVGRAGVVSGEPLSRRRLLDAQRNLFELGLFRRVEVVPMPGHELRDERNIVVRLEEGEQKSYLFGIGYSNVDAARIILGWSHLNVLGRAYAFAAEVSLAQSRQQYSLSLRNRRPLGLPVPGHLAVYRTTQIVADRDLLRRGLWIDFGDRLRRPLRPWLRYEYEIVQPDGPPIDPRIEEFAEAKVASITPSLEWDTRDNPLAPSRGVFASASVQYAFPAFLADEHFLKVQTGATVYTPLWRGFLAAGLRFGAIEPFGADAELAENLQIPFAYRLFAGGRTTHRAFDTDTLGIPGQTVIEGAAVGGNALVLINLEYRRHVAGEFWAAAFIDAGNVWGSPGQVELGEIRWGAGLGVQYRTPAGPLRAEYAWKLDREPGESSGRFFISFGVPF